MVTLKQKWGGLVVTLTTLFSSIGGFVVMPMISHAASCPSLSAGQYVTYKGQISLLDDSSRWVFINKDAFLTWQASAAKLKTIKDSACLASFPIGGKVGYRPGSKLIKSGADFYAVGPDNNLHKLGSAVVAKALYGTGYKGLAKPMPAGLYTMGASLNEPMVHDGMLIKKKGDKAIWYVSGTSLVMVNGKLPAFLLKDVRTVAATAIAGLEISTDSITGAEIVADPSQGAETKIVEESASTTTPVSTNVDTSKFTGANYTGSFPAPEGIVLEGWTGENSWLEPTGSGDYRYKVEKTFRQPLACLDKTRTIVGSKGKTWEEGWYKGYDLGKVAGEAIIPIYYETPQGEKSGNALYSEGYRLGYNYGFKGGFYAIAQYTCKSSIDLTRMDNDGWYQYGAASDSELKTKIPNLVNVSTPVNPWGYLSTSGIMPILKTIPNVAVVSMDTVIDSRKPENSEYNTGKAAVNLSRVEIFEDTEADDNAMTPKDFAKAFYDTTKQSYEKVNKGNECTLSDATIEDKTYGNHTFTLLTYYSTCVNRKSVSPLDKGDEGGIVINNIRYTFTGKLQAFAFTKGSESGHLFGFYFVDPFDIHTKGATTKDDLDMSKLPSNPFIEQFLTKIKVK